MILGWFVGDFSPCVMKRKDLELAIKYYKTGDCEKRHSHKIATEVTAVIYGKVKMNDRLFEKGAIITIEPGESTDFLVLEDSATVVVKSPSVPGDKYFD